MLRLIAKVEGKLFVSINIRTLWDGGKGGSVLFRTYSARKFLFLKLITERDRASSYDLWMCSSLNGGGFKKGEAALKAAGFKNLMDVYNGCVYYEPIILAPLRVPCF